MTAGLNRQMTPSTRMKSIAELVKATLHQPPPVFVGIIARSVARIASVSTVKAVEKSLPWMPANVAVNTVTCVMKAYAMSKEIL